MSGVGAPAVCGRSRMRAAGRRGDSPRMPARPLVFALRGHRRFLPPGTETGTCAVRRFANGELVAQLRTPVAGRRCLVLGSVAPPEPELARLSLVAHTLRRAGAARVVAVLPYLAYARQDVAAPGQSLGAGWIGELLRASGVDEVVTVDIHSARAAALLGMPVTSLSPAALLVEALPGDWRDRATFVAPDEGAIERCAAVAAAAGRPEAVAHLVKRRDGGGVVHLALRGDVAGRALIVDDILDTGGTVVSCCRMLRASGRRRVAVAVTHGLFTADAGARLAAGEVEAVWATDSVRSPRRPDTTRIVRLAPVLAPAFAPG